MVSKCVVLSSGPVENNNSTGNEPHSFYLSVSLTTNYQHLHLVLCSSVGFRFLGPSIHKMYAHISLDKSVC
jgi:hypothetical protein